MSNPSDIAIRYSVQGIAEVMTAMRSIESIITGGAKRMASASSSADAARVTSAKQSAAAEGRAKEAEYRAFARRVDQIKERSATMAGKYAAKQAAAEIAEERKAAAGKASIREKSATMAGTYAKQQAAAEASAAKKAASERARASQALAREERRIQREIIRDQVNGRRLTTGATSAHARLGLLHDARNRSPEEQRAAVARARDLGSDHKVYSSAHERESRENEHETNARRQRYVDATFAGTTNAVRHVVNGGRAVTRAALDLGGGFSVQEAMKENVDLQRNSIRFSNSAFQNRPGEKRLDAKTIEEQARVNAIKYNTDASELLEGSSAYGAKSGDYSGGLRLQGTFAKIAKGTDATVADVAKTAGILRVQNKDLGEKEMTQLLLNTIRQGQIGSVEFSDLGKVAGNFTKSSTSYVGEQGKNQGILLGLGQKAMATAGRDPREAATVISNVASDTINHRKEAEKLYGKGIFDSTGRIAMRPDEMIATALENSGGDLGKLGAVYKGRSIKMFQASLPEFGKARDTALAEGKSKSEANKIGADAVRADLKPLVEASMTMGELEANVGEIMKSSAEQFEGAVRELKIAVGQELVPALRELLPTLRECIPPLRDFLRAMVEVVTWAKSHPFQGMLALLAASIGKEVTASIIQAQIGEVIKRTLMSGAGPGGVPLPGTGGVPGVGPGGVPGAAPAAGGGVASFAANASIAGGVLAQVYGASKLADDVFTSVSSGHEEGRKLGADLNSTDPKVAAAAQERVMAASRGSSWHRQLGAWSDVGTRAVNYALNPAASVGHLGADWITNALGGKSIADRRNSVIKDAATLDGVSAGPAAVGNLVSPVDKAATEATAANTKATEDASKATADLVAALKENTLAAKSGGGGLLPIPGGLLPNVASPGHPSRGYGSLASPRRPEGP